MVADLEQELQLAQRELDMLEKAQNESAQQLEEYVYIATVGKMIFNTSSSALKARADATAFIKDSVRSHTYQPEHTILTLLLSSLCHTHWFSYTAHYEASRVNQTQLETTDQGERETHCQARSSHSRIICALRGTINHKSLIVKQLC